MADSLFTWYFTWKTSKTFFKAKNPWILRNIESFDKKWLRIYVKFVLICTNFEVIVNTVVGNRNKQ